MDDKLYVLPKCKGWIGSLSNINDVNCSSSSQGLPTAKVTETRRHHGEFNKAKSLVGAEIQIQT